MNFSSPAPHEKNRKTKGAPHKLASWQIKGLADGHLCVSSEPPEISDSNIFVLQSLSHFYSKILVLAELVQIEPVSFVFIGFVYGIKNVLICLKIVMIQFLI